MAQNYFLLKSEPFVYSFDQLVADGQTFWDGVRSYGARLVLNSMTVGDLAYFYHSNKGKEIVGIVKIVKGAYPDPTTDDPRWVVVDVAPVCSVTTPMTLEQIRKDKALVNIGLLKLPRHSVSPMTADEFRYILERTQTKLPKGVWKG
jgi:predicted RNA-binding protein with PUA-like domain